MRHYWKENGCLVLCTDDDDETDDMLEWFRDYQNGGGDLLEIDVEDRPMRGRPMNQMTGRGPQYAGRNQSMGRLAQRRRGATNRDGDGSRRRDGDGSRRRDTQED